MNDYNLEIDKNKGTVLGVITACKRAGGSSKSVYFSFVVNGTEFEVKQKKSINVGDCVITQDCIGMEVIVEYSKLNPEIARIKMED